MFSIENLHCVDKIALAGFAISIPLNAFMFLCPTPNPQPDDELTLAGMFYVITMHVGEVVGFGALICAFAHFGWIYAILFLVPSVLSYFLFGYLAGVIPISV